MKKQYDYAEFEIDCLKIVSKVLLICEAELAKRNDKEKALPYAAMAVRESLLAFLTLTRHK